MTYVKIRNIIDAESRRGGQVIKYSELCKILKKAGCKIVRMGAGHEIWISPGGKKFTVGRHKTQDVPKGTLKSIMESAGIE